MSIQHAKPLTRPRTAGIETDIPARLDRLPWGSFHWLLICALGVTWVLDGLEATIVAAIGPMLKKPTTLGLSNTEMGVAGAVYLAGCIGGALVFGHLTDQLGRKRLFSVTLGVYLAGALLTALAWDFWSFLAFRCLTGTAIGGEYAAINSAIDELIPAPVRGRVDLAINATYWLGAIAGAGASVLLLDDRFFPDWLGWRLSFGLGVLVGGVMIFVRHYVPESPRWLLTHGRHDEAEEITRSIESSSGQVDLPRPAKRMTVHPGTAIGFGTIAKTLFVRYRSRAVLGLVLIASQAFFYNGISFSFPFLLNRDFGVPVDRTGAYVVCMAAANLVGPLVLGHFFDTIGRRRMIAGTYTLSGLVIIVTEVLYLHGDLTAVSQTALWMAGFFFASAAASAGYLTVSEVFPLEMRALAIAFFYSIGTAIGGLLPPALFGLLLDSQRKDLLSGGYLFGAALMIAAAATEWWIGVDSERKSLEDIAAPLSMETGEGPIPGDSAGETLLADDPPRNEDDSRQR
jgi:MFS family permease